MSENIESENISEETESEESGEWEGWDRFLSKEPKPTAMRKLIPILRDMMPTIENWRHIPALIQPLTAVNKKLNLPYEVRRFVNSVIKAVQSDEGLEELKDFINTYKDGDELPDLSKYVKIDIEDEIPEETEQELQDRISRQADKRNGDSDDELLQYYNIPDPVTILEQLKDKGLNRQYSTSIDEENAQYFIMKVVSFLWDSVYVHGMDKALLEVRTGDHFHDTVARIFRHELEETEKIGKNIPSGYSFGKDPLLMQLHVAYKVSTELCFMNLSGTGAGKTLSAVLASRIIDSKLTVIVCPKEIVPQWRDVILGNEKEKIPGIYPDSHVIIDKEEAKKVKRDETKHQYIILNYDRFSQPDTRELVKKIVRQKIDFIVIDEIQLVKKRYENREVSQRHDNITYLRMRVGQKNPDAKILGMTATPVINHLMEGKSLLQLVTGKEYEDLDTKPYPSNAFALHKNLVLHSTRFIPKYNTHVFPKHIDVEIEQPKHLTLEVLRKNPMIIEQALVMAKLPQIIANIDKEGQTVIYTEYVTGITNVIAHAVREEGYSYGFLIGEDHTGLKLFKQGKIQVLIASHPASVGVDGLQDVCNRLIISCLPWTNAQLQQLIGRIYREGQQKDVDVIMIRGIITRKDKAGNIHRYPYDPAIKWRKIVDKRTLADCAVDGIYPEHNLGTIEQARRELLKWIERLERGEISTIERKDLSIELTAEEREERIRLIGDLARMNKQINQETSEETFKRVQENPIYLEQFHRNFREAKEEWPIIPVQVIADKIRYIQAPRYMKKLIVGDFGAGEAELSQMLKDDVNKVYSFDRSNILNKDIIECNMIHTQLENEELDVGVYSLSLENKDWKKHIAEASRTITNNGYLFIAVTTESLEEGKRLHTLSEVLRTNKFEYTEEQRYKFTFLDCRKVNNKFRR